MSTTFNCPFCGAPITGPGPGATFACPYCRAKVMAPYAGQPTGPQSARQWDGGASESDYASEGPFSNGVDSACAAFDPQLGLVLVGAYEPVGKPAVLRAYEARGKRVIWEGLQGQSWLERVSRSSMAIRGRNLYIANKRQLMCFDLMNGNRKWAGSLSDEALGFDDHDGLSIGDPFPPGQRGAILVPTIDHHVFAFDRDSGQPLWQRSFGDKDVWVEAVANLGACVVRYGDPYTKIDIVNPAYQQPIASHGHDYWSTDLGKARVMGRTVIVAAEDMGHEGDNDGLFCFDAVTGQPHFSDWVEDLDTNDVSPCIMGQRAFASMSDGAGIYVGPRGRPMPVPVPNHVLCAMFAAGPTLLLLLRKAHGTPVRRIVGLDPNTLQFRFDAGEAGSEPDDDWDDQVASDGYTAVFVAAPDDDRDRCELRSIDTSTGRMLWRKPVGEWRAHRFENGHLMVWADGKVEALSPQNGQVVASITQDSD